MLPGKGGLQPAHCGSTHHLSRSCVPSLKLGEKLPHAGKAGTIISGRKLGLEDRRSWLVGWFCCFAAWRFCLLASLLLYLMIFLLVDSREDLFAGLVYSLGPLADCLHVNINTPEEDSDYQENVHLKSYLSLSFPGLFPVVFWEFFEDTMSVSWLTSLDVVIPFW